VQNQSSLRPSHLHNMGVHRQKQARQCALDVPLKATDDKATCNKLNMHGS